MAQQDCDWNAEEIKSGLAFLEGSKISFSFDGKKTIDALKDVKFKIEKGTINAIIGESGSGKSTLLKIIYGLLQSQTGAVYYQGKRVLGPKEKLIPGHPHMQLVSQNFDDLNLFASVWENIAAELSNADIKSKNRKTEAILKRLKITHIKDQRIFDLSGGEKQRVAIAKALINKPEVLLMDEPFNQVDASFREELQEDIRHIVLSSGITVVLVSHDPAEVLSLADQLMVLKGGQSIASGNPKHLFENPPNTYTAKLLAKANVLDKKDAKILKLNISKKAIIHQNEILLQKSLDNNDEFFLKQIKFKGYFHELVIGHRAYPKWQLLCLQMNSSSFNIQENLLVEIKNFIEVNH